MDEEMKLKTKDLLTLNELGKAELAEIIDNAIKMKKDLKKGISKPLLKNKTLAMVFQKPSTRTRISFETGMFQLGGHALNLSADELQLKRGETIEDTAKTLSRYVDLIMARVYSHDEIELLAKNSSVPVMNGLSDSFHPCQILADLMTIKEKKKKLSGLKLAWIGDGNNVCNSMIYGCAKTGIEVSIATPKGY
ncbi:Ornithine carbamoyltransferase [Candidatus Nitrosotalea sp. TS]|nr:Ornithine carbamoyltransferase [Candidatus Nitrosotalea sp. TS]